MSKIVLRSLNLLLGLFFIFLGILKITPLLSRLFSFINYYEFWRIFIFNLADFW